MPDFHHWHHAKGREYCDAGYAVHLPVIEMMLGDLQISEKAIGPTAYGVVSGEPPLVFRGRSCTHFGDHDPRGQSRDSGQPGPSPSVRTAATGGVGGHRSTLAGASAKQLCFSTMRERAEQGATVSDVVTPLDLPPTYRQLLASAEELMVATVVFAVYLPLRSILDALLHFLSRPVWLGPAGWLPLASLPASPRRQRRCRTGAGRSARATSGKP